MFYGKGVVVSKVLWIVCNRGWQRVEIRDRKSEGGGQKEKLLLIRSRVRMLTCMLKQVTCTYVGAFIRTYFSAGVRTIVCGVRKFFWGASKKSENDKKMVSF